LNAPSVKEREESELLVLANQGTSISKLIALFARDLESTMVDPLAPSVKERVALEPLEHVRGMTSTSREIVSCAQEDATYHQELL